MADIKDVRLIVPEQILPPPRRTGNTDLDVRQLSDYVQKLYELLTGIRIAVDREDENGA